MSIAPGPSLLVIIVEADAANSIVYIVELLILILSIVNILSMSNTYFIYYVSGSLNSFNNLELDILNIIIFTRECYSIDNVKSNSKFI